MKAVYLDRPGGPEVLQYGDQPDPVAGPGQVVVDAHAASVNGVDWRVRAGLYGNGPYPLILGRDFSGVVSAVGQGVTDLRVGDDVFGVLEAGREGAYAEKIAIGAAIVAKKPAALSHVDAAALALTGLTALVSVEDTLKLKAGETILIQGGAGGVASFAIQLAKHLGARVITTASAANAAYLRGLGADEVIDYHSADVAEATGDIDVAVDLVGSETTLAQSVAVTRPGGLVVAVPSGTSPELLARAAESGVRVASYLVEPDGHALAEIAALIECGAVRAEVEEVFPLADAAAAHRRLEDGRTRGKLVLAIR